MTFHVAKVEELHGYSLKINYLPADPDVRDTSQVSEIEFVMPVITLKMLRKKVEEMVGE